MERKFYTDNFEQLLKEKSDEFRMYPSKRVWHSIYNDLHPGRKWPSIAVSMVLIISLLLVGYWNNNASDKTATAASVQNNNSHSSVAANNLASNTITLAANQASMNGMLSAENNALPVTGMLPVIAFNNNTTVTNGSHSSLYNITADGAGVALRSTGAKYKHSASKTRVAVKAGNATAAETGRIVTDDDITLPQAAASVVASASLSDGNDDGTNKTGAVKGSNNTTTTITNSEEEAVAEATNTGADNSNTDKNGTEAASTVKAEKPKTATLTADQKNIGTEDKAWVDDYAFYNRPKRRKWEDLTTLEFYVTPNVGYRTLNNDPKYNAVNGSASLIAPPGGSSDVNQSVRHKPGLGLEAGFTFNYSAAKNLVLKAGIQANYTNYGVGADEINHPVSTNLMLIDFNTGNPYLRSASSTLASTPGSNAVKVHNTTYQFSVPVGFAFKLSGNNKFEWYAGATFQPTFVVLGKAFLISADRKNYVADPSVIRRWNFNTGIETYFKYKFEGFSIHVGPQLRYQLLSTYNKNYTVSEKLYNVGVKIGIVRSF